MRNEYRNDWSIKSQAFQPLTEREPMAERRRYTATDVGNAYTDGVRNGWVGAAAFYLLITVVVILAFHFLEGA